MTYQLIERGKFTGERALYKSEFLEIRDSIFFDGESPLKESNDLIVLDCLFRWKYPFWYCNHVLIERATFFDMARAGIWYTNDLTMKDTIVEAPKAFRRCEKLSLSHTVFTNASETLWHCKNIVMDEVTAKGDYFAMNSSDMEIDHLQLVGNYSFDGCRNLNIKNSRLISKDAFWNCENITVSDSFITGEYLGWNAKNLTFINCTIESLQGLCYIDNLKMTHCKLINTTLAFEYSTVDADIEGGIDSVLNPTSGTITADYIDTLILEKDKIDPAKTHIYLKQQKQ